eukprot:6203379-Pleurochrysis_carterae.AAC.3
MSGSTTTHTHTLMRTRTQRRRHKCAPARRGNGGAKLYRRARLKQRTLPSRGKPAVSRLISSCCESSRRVVRVVGNASTRAVSGLLASREQKVTDRICYYWVLMPQTFGDGAEVTSFNLDALFHRSVSAVCRRIAVDLGREAVAEPEGPALRRQQHHHPRRVRCVGEAFKRVGFLVEPADGVHRLHLHAQLAREE